MNLYTLPFTPVSDGHNAITSAKLNFLDNVFSISYEYQDQSKNEFTVNLNELRARSDFKNHTVYVFCYDGSIANLYEATVKIGVPAQKYFQDARGLVVSVVVQDSPKEDPVISLVMPMPTTITPELSGDVVIAGVATSCFYPLGPTNTNS